MFCLPSSCLVFPVLLVSLDCPFLIAPSVFSDIHGYNTVPIGYYIDKYLKVNWQTAQQRTEEIQMIPAKKKIDNWHTERISGLYIRLSRLSEQCIKRWVWKCQGVIRICKAKKDKHYYDQTKKNERTNNNLQSITYKTKDRVTDLH